MIGIDTNILVRYVVRDDPRQTAAATRLIETFDRRAAGSVLLKVVQD